MHRHLTLDMDRVDVIVDLANVVREQPDDRARRSDLARLRGLIDALIDHFRDEDVLLYLVTDQSLLGDAYLTREELDTLDDWLRDGLIEVQKNADPRLLELAELLGVPVVSNDNYLDFHRTHTWIPGSRDRFLAHVPGPGGRIRVRRKVMPIPEEWKISVKEEESKLKAARLYDRDSGARTEILGRNWRCPVSRCTWFGARAKGRTGHVPLREGKSVLCPLHREPLRNLGPRPACAQMKVVVDGRVRQRFLIEEGHEVLVGRAPTGPRTCDLRQWLDAATSFWTSRTHLALELGPRGVTVHDRSTNGTRIRHTRDGDKDRWLRGTSHVLGPREVVVIHDRVLLERSGRTFVFDEGDPPAAPPRHRAPTGPTVVMNAAPAQGPRPRRRRP